MQKFCIYCKETFVGWNEKQHKKDCIDYSKGEKWLMRLREEVVSFGELRAKVHGGSFLLEV